MEAELYRNIMREVNNMDGLNIEGTKLKLLKEKFSIISEDTLRGILFLWNMRKTSRRAPIVKQTDVYTRYKRNVNFGEPMAILRIAEMLDYPPFLICKIVLECYLIEEEKFGDVSYEKHEERARFIKYGKNKKKWKHKIRTLCNNPELITDLVLQENVFHFGVADDDYGTVANSRNASVGKQYEKILQKHLEDVGIPYLSEDLCRRRGFDKTPDAKLLAPIVVDGVIINWIESKAMFVDSRQHEKLKDQYDSYANRFGPGCVIYWFSYVSNIVDSRTQKYIIRSSFPDSNSITFMNNLNN